MMMRGCGGTSVNGVIGLVENILLVSKLFSCVTGLSREKDKTWWWRKKCYFHKRQKKKKL